MRVSAKAFVWLITIFLTDSRYVSGDESGLRQARQLYQEGETLVDKKFQYEAGIKKFAEAMQLYEKHAGSDSAEVAACLNRMGTAYQARGLLNQSEPYLRNALAMRQKVLGPAHPKVAGTMSNLAGTWMAQGKYAQALNMHKSAIKIFHDSLGEKNIDYGLSFCPLANAYHQMGMYAEAEQLWLKAMHVADMQQNLDPVHAVRLMNNMATIYLDQLAFEKSRATYERALKIMEALPEPNKKVLSTVLSNLGSVYKDMNDFAKAESLQMRALAIRKDIKDEDGEANSIEKIADIQMLRGDHSAAEANYQDALVRVQKLYGPQHPETARLLVRLADLYTNTRKYAQAENSVTNALSTIRASYGPDSVKELDALDSLARVLTLTKRTQAASATWNRILLLMERRFRDERRNFSNDRVLDFMDMMSTYQSELIWFYNRTQQDSHPQPQFPQMLLAFNLHYSSRSLDEAMQISRSIYQGMGPQDREAFAQLNALRTQIARLAYRGPRYESPREHEIQLQALVAQAEAQEEDLARRSAPLRAQRELPSLEHIVPAVAARLSPDAALVTFIEYEALLSGEPQPHPPRDHQYLALVLTPDGHVSLQPLGAAQPIDEAAAQLLSAVSHPEGQSAQAAAALYRLVMQPLVPLLDKRTRLFIAPDGALNLIPFEVLHDGQRYLADRYLFNYVTSGRDLLPRPVAEQLSTDVVVIADPDFSAEPAPSAAPGATELPARRARSFQLTEVVDLPDTRKEAEAIRSMFPQARVLLGREATEEALLGLHAPGVLHVATHGLFTDDIPADMGAIRGLYVRDSPPPPNPLLRSALLLSGVKRLSQQPMDPLQPNQTDGLVTALELSGVNLWGTQLVVLSACNTGRGTVRRGQGVYGLRRAVVTAGAETLVMSLWKVDDAVTREIMTSYYRNLLHGAGRVTGLHDAARELRARHPSPYYWASFIAIGRDAPLQRIR